MTTTPNTTAPRRVGMLNDHDKLTPGTVAYHEHRLAGHRWNSGAHEPSTARAMGKMLDGWEEYAAAHYSRFGSPLGEDYFLGEQWAEIGRALRALLNGEVGGWDCGTLDGNLLDCATENGCDLEK
jgi:hypothetical protein